jgi:hypothetical protein
MISLFCIKCEEYIDIEDPFSKLSEVIVCPNCKQRYKLDYDSCFDETSAESSGYFSLHLEET